MGTPESVTPPGTAVAPEVETAKVSRSAAVWVAAITAIGGFATAVAVGAFGLVGKSKAPPKQRWLRVEAVQLVRDPALPAVDRVRLVVHVNNVAYSYPTSVQSLWAPVGPGMATERYPLPATGDAYRVKFYAFGYVADGKVPRYEYRGVDEYSLQRLPQRGLTQALQLSTSDQQGLATGMVVRYSIE